MSGDLAVIDSPRLDRPPLPTPQAAEKPIVAAVDHGDSHSVARTWKALVSSLLRLTKPRIVVMILVAAAMSALFTGGPSVLSMTIVHLMLGTAAVAGSASVLNQWWERDADSRMRRTKNRPLPRKEVSPTQAIIFGLSLGLIGTAYLAWQLDWVTAGIGIATWVGYVVVYTPLKRWTAWNTTVGAVAGALPMLMGFTAAGGQLSDVRGWLLVAILFCWQYPHFMAIAWMYRDEYAGAGFKMTPNAHSSGKGAGLQAIAGATALPAALVALTWPFDHAWVFGALAIAASAGMLRSSFRFYLAPNDQNARKLLRSSLVQLPASMAVLIAARLIG